MRVNIQTIEQVDVRPGEGLDCKSSYNKFKYHLDSGEG